MAKIYKEILRKIPSVDALLKDYEGESSKQSVSREILVHSIRNAIEKVRNSICEKPETELSEKELDAKIKKEITKWIHLFEQPYYRKVINATGIILHTSLGRAVLPEKAIKHISDELSAYSVLQLSTKTGKRSRREERIEFLLHHLTGAESATVVNNNAAATFIVLNTIARDKEVIVSRGQLVEIGGAFRLPDVMAFSGARLVEVGTTNKTHLHDYADAITENTAAILRVHPSNYKIQGFTSEVGLEEMVELAHSRNLIMIDDVGAGSLIDFSRFGFEPEPTIPYSIKTGSDIVTSSADKLLGGPQAGIIAGKSELIEKIRKNQFARIVRADKMTLAALESTLQLFLDEETALREVPTIEMVLRDTSTLRKRAKRIASQLKKVITLASINTCEGFSQVGSGSLPLQNLSTVLVSIQPEKISAEKLSNELRHYSIPIFTRIQNEAVLIDPRTLRKPDDKIIIKALSEILSDKESRDE
ncbi:MAG: L-seryl-tRNA(Sec) selenium transferase [Planctomycetota bacterium]|jgi:L-seryl-tRNA(Ser) seleniumtransferase